MQCRAVSFGHCSVHRQCCGHLPHLGPGQGHNNLWRSLFLAGGALSALGALHRRRLRLKCSVYLYKQVIRNWLATTACSCQEDDQLQIQIKQWWKHHVGCSKQGLSFFCTGNLHCQGPNQLSLLVECQKVLDMCKANRSCVYHSHLRSNCYCSPFVEFMCCHDIGGTKVVCLRFFVRSSTSCHFSKLPGLSVHQGLQKWFNNPRGWNDSILPGGHCCVGFWKGHSFRNGALLSKPWQNVSIVGGEKHERRFLKSHCHHKRCATQKAWSTVLCMMFEYFWILNDFDT